MSGLLLLLAVPEVSWARFCLPRMLAGGQGSHAVLVRVPKALGHVFGLVFDLQAPSKIRMFS